MPTATDPQSLADVASEDVIAAAEQAANAPAQGTRKKLSMPIVTHMQKAGLIENDDDQTALTVLKRVNHAIFANESTGNIPELQQAFRQKLAEANGDITQLTQGGADSPVAQLVQDYLAARAEHYAKSARNLRNLPRSSMGSYELSTVVEEAEAKAEKFTGEREAYARMPRLINDTVAKYPQVFDRYHHIGEIAQISGIVKGEPAATREKIDDVMAEVAASRLFDIAPKVMTLEKNTLRNMVEDPKEYSTNIILAAEHTALHTKDLERITLFDNSNDTPQMRQILALNTLLSAHLHALTSHSRNADGSPNPSLETLANNLSGIPSLVHEYQMAGASLVHHFLDSGASATDQKMKSLDENFVSLAESRQIPLVDSETAQRAAVSAAEKSGAFLRQKYAGSPELLAKVETLVSQASGQSTQRGFAAKEGEPEPSFVEKAAKGVSALFR